MSSAGNGKSVIDAISLISGLITIGGFLVALTRLSTVQIDVAQALAFDAVTSSLLFSVLALLISALIFGYGFSVFHVFVERKFGRITTLSSAPVFGVISGFQSAAIALIFTKIFGLSSGVGFYLFFSFFTSSAFETALIVRRCEIVFSEDGLTTFTGKNISIEEAQKTGVDGFPKNSISLSMINQVFFAVGFLICLVDTAILNDTNAWVVAILFGGIATGVSYLLGLVFFELMKQNQ